MFTIIPLCYYILALFFTRFSYLPDSHIEPKINVNELSEWSRDNIRKLLALVAKGGLEQQVILPCRCQAVALRVLLLSESFLCQRCSSFYRYSFCWGQIVEDDQTYHCEDCEDCYDWRDWAEESCRRCAERDDEMDWRAEHGYE